MARSLDLMIAIAATATATAHAARLATRNLDHLRHLEGLVGIVAA